MKDAGLLFRERKKSRIGFEPSTDMENKYKNDPLLLVFKKLQPIVYNQKEKSAYPSTYRMELEGVGTRSGAAACMRHPYVKLDVGIERCRTTKSQETYIFVKGVIVLARETQIKQTNPKHTLGVGRLNEWPLNEMGFCDRICTTHRPNVTMTLFSR